MAISTKLPGNREDQKKSIGEFILGIPTRHPLAVNPMKFVILLRHFNNLVFHVIGKLFINLLHDYYHKTQSIQKRLICPIYFCRTKTRPQFVAPVDGTLMCSQVDYGNDNTKLLAPNIWSTTIDCPDLCSQSHSTTMSPAKLTIFLAACVILVLGRSSTRAKSDDNPALGGAPQLEFLFNLMMRLRCPDDQKWNNVLKLCIVVPTAPTQGTTWTAPTAPTVMSTPTPPTGF